MRWPSSDAVVGLVSCSVGIQNNGKKFDSFLTLPVKRNIIPK